MPALGPEGDFVGANGALLCEGEILAYLRDDMPGLRYANWWDLPGGGREGDESPQTCFLREMEEEFGLRLGPERLIWSREFPSLIDHHRRAWFYGGYLSRAEIAAIRFGDEGQRWEMMPLPQFLSHPRMIPALQAHTVVFLADIGAQAGG
jgi:8-oxo-dGTP diphosphatase